jgi:hypothetical protein
MRKLLIVLALSLSVLHSHAIGPTSAFSEDATAATVGEARVGAPSILPVRLSSLDAAKDAANSTPWAGTKAFSSKREKLQVAGACAGSRYTCGPRYPYCCFSENRGYYCRLDAKHC